MRPPCGLREPHEKLARSAPLLFGERVGVRGNMRPPCGLREPHEKLARSAPLLFGERVGVRGNMRPPCGLREPHEKMARSAPSPLWGEGWGEGNMRLRWWFRSLYVLHFSFSRITRERARGARRLPPGYPGSRPGKSPLRGTLSLFLQAFGSGTSLHPCRLCPLGASLRLAPAFRKRFGDFQPAREVAVSLLKYCDYFIALRAIKLLWIPPPCV
ncbi:Uncharacterised protein [Leclercia adecarboxylata]|uniref:Uncharacterized protein n=1 Tax=Leclercia adecarboxylata TaxID=83655 RepID=A0A855EVF5_9ENTR|nr:hypothetical protein CRX53_03970 [Leclercia adecarboxylata]SPX66413.1 Uncharacterised protein [Leclercia adecarboxylata]STX25977.1 Uncharacterised protein [Leclercia adecarboxylata]